ncbi:hypothetical protein BC829DRAFT_443982 [Chytridium lagenaria]|nr:hypothetical protein BC829DRAFT_443982 [Chytridium lagenaria]
MQFNFAFLFVLLAVFCTMMIEATPGSGPAVGDPKGKGKEEKAFLNAPPALPQLTLSERLALAGHSPRGPVMRL